MLTAWVAARDRRTPIVARAIAWATAAYALSPIDLVPDFIPVLGLLDDLLVVPAGIWLVLRLVPAELMEDYRAIGARIGRRPTSLAGMFAIVGLWLLFAALVRLFFLRG